MLTREFRKDNLLVKIYDSRSEMGKGAAADAVAYLNDLLTKQEQVNIIFAAAPSQNEFLAAVAASDVDWTRVNAFHMDEYIGLDKDAPQGFGNFLKEHLFDPDLYIGRLHERCGMSDTYFRRLFFSQFGQTPKKYVSYQRLIHARAMIEGGEYDSIAQVAQMCGFDDPLYFSKVYKNQYGHAPTK